MIYNASAYKAVEDKEVRDFLHFVMTNDPGENDFNKLLSDTVRNCFGAAERSFSTGIALKK